MATQIDPEPHDDEDAPVDTTALVLSAAEHIAAETRRHPLRTLGIAFGAGWVLGGGVPKFVVRMALVAGVRTAARAIITSDAAAELASRVLGDLRDRSRAAKATPKNGTPDGGNGHSG
jgi:hypothetical protein